MAVETSNGHPAMDYREHVRTYNGFLRMTVASIIFCGVILAGMLIFLVP